MFIIIVVTLLHVAIMPAALDCHESGHPSHDSHQHALCHCSCCPVGEFAADEAIEFTRLSGDQPSLMPDPLHGRDVVFLLFRPPKAPASI